MKFKFVLFLFCFAMMPTACSGNLPADLPQSDATAHRAETATIPAQGSEGDKHTPTDAPIVEAEDDGDFTSIEEIEAIDYGAPVEDIAWLPDGDELLVFGGDGRLQRMDANSGRFSLVAVDESRKKMGDPSQLPGDFFSKPNIFLAGDGQSLAVAMADRVVIYDTDNWREIAQFEWSICMQASDFSPDLSGCYYSSGYSNANSYYMLADQEDPHAARLSANIEEIIFPKARIIIWLARLHPMGGRFL
jgi:hypothetical protein